jgi:GT2 family glycosyltransferase
MTVDQPNPKLGIVVIGRNEGHHLASCINSLSKSYPIIYIDSSSEDDSVGIAQKLGIDVVSLNGSSLLCAARGRNEGFIKLTKQYPKIDYIQFVDGDTAIAPGWLEKAQKKLDEQKDITIIAGDLREKDHSNSIFKELSAMEWEQGSGEVPACGGNCMVRADDFRKAKGYDATLPAGEDIDFCFRIRLEGGKVFHLAEMMGTHDSAIDTFMKFWNRSKRTGHAYQQVSRLHASDPDKLFRRENISNWIFGGIIPLLSLVLIPFTHGWSLLLFLIYPLMVLRIYLRSIRHWSSRQSLIYGLACMLSKFPGFIGACQYLLEQKRKKSQ